MGTAFHICLVVRRSLLRHSKYRGIWRQDVTTVHLVDAKTARCTELARTQSLCNEKQSDLQSEKSDVFRKYGRTSRSPLIYSLVGFLIGPTSPQRVLHHVVICKDHCLDSQTKLVGHTLKTHCFRLSGSFSTPTTSSSSVFIPPAHCWYNHYFQLQIP